MIKKYVMIIAVLLVLLMFTSTSTATFLTRGTIYERLAGNPAFERILDRLSQVTSNNNDIVSNDADEDDEEYDDGEYDDGNDEEYDDEMDPDGGPEEDELLPKIWEVGFYWTPPNDGNDEAPSGDGTIDYPDGEANNGTTTDECEWTVDPARERFVKKIMDIVPDGKLEAMLQIVVERTFALGTTDSDGIAENDVVGVVVEGGSIGTPRADIANNVVVVADGD